MVTAMSYFLSFVPFPCAVSFYVQPPVGGLNRMWGRAQAPACGVLLVVPARHRYLAGARELANAVAAEEVLKRIELALGAGGLHRERVLAHVHDVGAEDARDLDDLVAALRLALHLEEHQLALDGVVLGEVGDLEYRDELV